MFFLLIMNSNFKIIFFRYRIILQIPQNIFTFDIQCFSLRFRLYWIFLYEHD